ncbi:MAG: hypothetical protein FJY95_09915 [Candidatus Handelsmanbacteria bacterium]|nr:hypothetical protein [Candidatus Handelsmanbacteria bacterium]
MSRDRVLFVGFVLAFVLLNAILLVTGKLSANWTGLGVITAAGFSLALYSFLYQDNPLFKFAEHVYVGVAAAYTFGQVWFPTLYSELIASFAGQANGAPASAWLAAPALLGLLMMTRVSRRWGWLSRYAFAFVVGLGAGLTIPRTISAFLLSQIEPTIRPLSWSIEGFNLLIILIGVVSVLIYFFFSVEHTGVVGRVSRVGIWFLMVSFGASFGYTIMARLSLLIGRVSFLLSDWLHLID